MGIQEWADRQVRKNDLRRAIEETHFQIRLWEGLKVALELIEYDNAVANRFYNTLPEYLDRLISGLRETEASLWGFKRNPLEWTESVKMIASGAVRWDEDRRERLILADAYLSDLRRRLTSIQDSLGDGHLTAPEAIVTLKSEIDCFHQRCLDHYERLEEEATAGGFADQGVIEKHKKLAEKRVGTIIKEALSQPLR